MTAAAHHSRLHTPLCELMGCEYPILQAGMGGVARAELVAAVSDAGGYGFLGMVREPPERIQREIDRVRGVTDKPFGVNIIPAATDAALLQRQIDVCIKNRIHSVCLFWDVHADVVERFRDAGIRVLYQVGSVNDADAAWRAGAEILIVQGNEAGGHVRSTRSWLTLLPEIAARTPLPVVASGGIVSGQGMLAAMMLGAQGVHCGTLFLATSESNAHEFHKLAVLKASAHDTLLTELFHINWPEHAPVRVIQNSVTQSTRLALKTDPVIGTEGQRPIFLYSTDSPLNETTGELEAMALYAGEGITFIDNIVPAKNRIDTLIHQASAMLHTWIDETPYMEERFVESASPPCSLANADGRYVGYYDSAEILELLNTLLEGERAGAKIAAHSIRACTTAAQRQLLERIYAEEVRCCGVLQHAIRRMSGDISRRVSNFYERTMAIADLKKRLQFLNRGQEWVVRKLDLALPLIRDETLYADLTLMRRNHQLNIETTDHLFSE